MVSTDGLLAFAVMSLLVIVTPGPVPVLGAPHRGVGRVDGDDGDAESGRHGHQPGPQFGGGHTLACPGQGHGLDWRNAPTPSGP
ncbi:hypothetical protein GCM10010211_40140 [Streptomyces albospinus]|uniref:Uncharacterized protein n=1 Tax=Streptomyces albospinus TaxID=285515 RepID=A0ABQ2V600_9ACTN|nr:hypothetical protein GCM10010211_40140 [Streptomyces albospinus]